MVNYTLSLILYCAARNLLSILSSFLEIPVPEKNGEENRKLAFHEPRPCPTCKRMYRDAATLRTHTAIMHSKGKEPFKYDDIIYVIIVYTTNFT